ncbi:MAG: gliding motility-associated C-terminal domain-containing protein [Chitinophagaceae bacterium]|nr:gliding motility-associated C-terminal domain-containing protein [Chitinophagaceae bacterium]
MDPLNGSIDPLLSLPGSYRIIYELSPSGCYTGSTKTTKEITLYKCNCRLQTPNAFTPNGDGRNDLYVAIPTTGCLLEQYQLRVYNRYGNCVFSSSMPSQRWDGRFRGSPQPNGGYVFSVQYQFKGQPLNFSSGTLLLIR